jgi:hypothetical protein
MPDARLIAWGLLALGGCDLETSLDLDLEPQGTVLLASATDDELKSLVVVELPVLFARADGLSLTLALYRRSPEALGLRDLRIEAIGRALPWPERWRELPSREGAWLPEAASDRPPPPWARAVRIGGRDMATCARWQGAPRVTLASVRAAARWDTDAVIVAEVGTASVVVLTAAGGRAPRRGSIELSGAMEMQLASIGFRDALLRSANLLYRVRDQEVRLYRGDTSDVSVEGERALILSGGAEADRTRVELIAGVVSSTVPAMDVTRIWALGGGELYGYQSSSKVLDVSYRPASGEAGVRTAWGSMGSRLGRETRAAARVGDELWVAVERDDATTLLMAASLADVAVVSDPPPQLSWRWLAELDQARDVRTMITDGDGVLLVGAEGLTRYSPAAGECTVATDLEQVDVLAPLSPTRLFVAGQRGGVPYTLWLEAP